jgi:hypothetical protein
MKGHVLRYELPNKVRLRQIDRSIKATECIDNFCKDPPVRGIDSQRVILFTGAGLSMALGYPSVREI